MGRKFSIDDYSKEKLNRAKMYETVKKTNIWERNKPIFMLCPHCHKQIDFFSYFDVLPDYSYTSMIGKKIGAELRCCRHCGEIYLDPRYREEALGGIRLIGIREYNIVATVLMVCVIPILIFLALFAVFTTYSEINWSSIFISFILSILCVIYLAAYTMLGGPSVVLQTVNHWFNKGTDLKKSEKRLQNIDYLKALDRIGRPLPEKYKEIISRGDIKDSTSDAADNFSEKTSPKISSLINGCCSYCGEIIKEPEAYSRFDRPITRCPKCHLFLYDSKKVELAAFPQSRWQDIYNNTSEEINLLRKKTLNFIFVLWPMVFILTVLVVLPQYFLYTCPENPAERSTFMQIISDPKTAEEILMAIVLFTCVDSFIIYFLYCKLAVLNSAIKSHNKSFDEVVSESEKRLKNSDYAEIVRKAIREYNTEQDK